MLRYLLSLFYIICLVIPVYSQQTVGIFQNDSTSFNGYTLFAPSSSRTTYLVNNCGEVIQTWISEFSPGASVYLLDNGNLLRTARINSSFNGGGSGGRLELYAWEGELLWSYNYSTDSVHQHHDIQPMPNGNILILAWERHSPEDAINSGRNPVTTPNNGVWSEQIVEVEMVGSDDINIVWEWHLWDHLVQDFDSTKANFGVVADHPERLDINYTGGSGGPVGNPDWVHFNSIDYNSGLDQILMSSRNLNEILIIDHSTTSEEAASNSGGNTGRGGDLLYRWGNPAVYGRGIQADRKFYGQHHATWIPFGMPDAGNIMVFNNGQGRPGGSHSTVDVIIPPLNSDGTYAINELQPFGPETLLWEYTANPPNSFYANRISGAQRLPNGNTLICEGTDGHFFEVDYEGNLVWDYISPVSGNNTVPQGSNPGQNDVFRATRFGPDYGAFVDKDMTPGLPIELNPIDIGCQIYGTVTTNTEDIKENAVKVLPNPFLDRLVIQNDTNQTFWIEVTDLTGRRLQFTKTENAYLELNTDSWVNGIYLLRVYDEGLNPYYTQKLIKQ